MCSNGKKSVKFWKFGLNVDLCAMMEKIGVSHQLQFETSESVLNGIEVFPLA